MPAGYTPPTADHYALRPSYHEQKHSALSISGGSGTRRTGGGTTQYPRNRDLQKYLPLPRVTMHKEATNDLVLSSNAIQLPNLSHSIMTSMSRNWWKAKQHKLVTG